jgi:Ca-activated chloride channel family protein
MSGKIIGMSAGVRTPSLILFFGVLTSVGLLGQAPQQPDRPTFRAGVEMVTISAVVRDHKGRIVQDLKQSDFQLIDNGSPRAISEFRADKAPVSLALLFDTSGSMKVASKIEAARAMADQLLAWLQPGQDEVAVYSFDKTLREVQPFTRDGATIRQKLGQVEEPYGQTSLHDAIAETARRVAVRGGSHRGVVVLTDGVDTSSRLKPAEVSGIASAIDVPIYIVAVVSPLDHVGQASAVVEGKASPAGELTDLAQWTGGDMFMSSAPAQSSLAARQILDELRHQYLIAFEPAGKPGWHPLEVRLRDRHLSVRARGGYFAGPSSPGY